MVPEEAEKFLQSWSGQGLIAEEGLGYRFPAWAIPKLEGWPAPYFYLPEVDSTQDELRELAELGAPAGTLVIAELQHAGRGRRGGKWESPPGAGLTFSVLLRPPSPGPYQLALSLAVQGAAGVGRVKWPNDILAPDGGKLAGILLEGAWRGDNLRYLLAGVGVNFAPSLQPGRSGIWQWSGLGRKDFLYRFWQHLQRWTTSSALAQAPEVFAQRWGALGQTVTAHTPSGDVTGKVVAIDPEGALVLEAPGAVRIPAGWLETS